MTGNRLRVVAPVVQIIVLFLAKIAHREIHHGRIVPVIRDPVDDSVARSADHAADEWVLIARITLVVEFFQAVRANGQVRRDHGGFIVALVAADDGKGIKIPALDDRPLDMDDLRRLRFLSLQGLDEEVDPFRLVGHGDLHQTADVQDFALHFQAVGDLSDKGPETDPLNDAP